MTQLKPSKEDGAEFLLQCRFNELEDVNESLNLIPSLFSFADEFGTTPLHMAAGNGHSKLLEV